jgi:hypothetical protein
MTIKTIPTVDDLAADVITHHYDDMIASPGLTNFLGTVRLGNDLTAITAVTFPPVSQGLALTGSLFVDGRLFESFGIPVAHKWRPDRVVRSADVAGLSIETTTVCVPGQTAIAIDVVVTNTGLKARNTRFTIAVNARVTQSADSWGDAESPSERNGVEADPGRNSLIFHSEDERAWSVQGLTRSGAVRLSGVPVGPTDEFDVGIGGAGRGGELEVELSLDPGASDHFGYVQAVARTKELATSIFDVVVADVPAVVVAAEEFWNHQLAAISTPATSPCSRPRPKRCAPSTGGARSAPFGSAANSMGTCSAAATTPSCPAIGRRARSSGTSVSALWCTRCLTPSR